MSDVQVNSDTQWAIEQLGFGNKVRRKDWLSGNYIYLNTEENTVHASNNDATILNTPLFLFNFMNHFGVQNDWELYQDDSMVNIVQEIPEVAKPKSVPFVRTLYRLPDGQSVDPALVCGVILSTSPTSKIIVRLWNTADSITLLLPDDVDLNDSIAKITSDINYIRMKAYAADLKDRMYGTMAWAMDQINNGVWVCRTSWPAEKYLAVDTDSQFQLWTDGIEALWVCKPSELVATDWAIYQGT